MAVIAALALFVGVVWNRTLLRDAWRGNPVSGGAGSVPTLEGVQPLPLGLMQAKEFFDRREATFVDARDSEAFSRGRIAGARSLPVAKLGPGLGRFRQTVPLSSLIVVYCTGFSCQDSRTVAEKLQRTGYATVYVYEGGFPEWQAAGYPVAKGGLDDRR
ncbi:MAG TPA: rhodanese-like domain-containing protein [Geobacteraceae bacterium]